MQLVPSISRGVRLGLLALMLWPLPGCALDRSASKKSGPDTVAKVALPAEFRVAPLPPLPEPRVVTAVQPVSHQQPLETIAPGTKRTTEPTNAAPASHDYLVDLPTVLRLANADNLQVGIARWQVEQALARQQRAETLWLPSIRAGANYNRHDGAIQDVVGNQFDTNRSAFYAGNGAGVFGAGAPMVPGVMAQFHLTDALFQPLAARQVVAARSHNAAAVRHNTICQASLAYQELLRAAQDRAVLEQTLDHAQQLAGLSRQFANVGQGPVADAERAAAELAQRQVELLRNEESIRVAGAKLAQLLRLDQNLNLLPAEPTIVPLDFVAVDTPLRDLIATGLSQRPELAEQRHLVCEAVARLQRERYAPMIPSVLLGASYGGMGAGVNGDQAAMQDRFDFDAVAYWELRNLGFGEQAARREASSVVRQQQLRQLDLLDQVAREVSEAFAQVQTRQLALGPAEQAWRAAAASQRQNWERIRAVQGLPIEVLQANTALDSAQRLYIRTIADYNAAQLNLQRALGYAIIKN